MFLWPVRSVKKAIELFGEHGFEMVMQNNVVVTIISATSLVAMLAGGGVGYGLASALALDVWGGLAIGIVLSAFIVEGSFVLLESGSMSILMCYVMSPQTLLQARPELYRLLQDASDTIAAAAQARATNNN